MNRRAADPTPLNRPADTCADPTPDDVVDAWQGLRTHPDLVWTPPLWRTSNSPAHQMAAVDHNLGISIGVEGGHVIFTLAMGPLRDRHLPDGIDPVAPLREVDERLTVEAETFEMALVKLHRRVMSAYGHPDEVTDRRAPA